MEPVGKNTAKSAAKLANQSEIKFENAPSKKKRYKIGKKTYLFPKNIQNNFNAIITELFKNSTVLNNHFVFCT